MHRTATRILCDTQGTLFYDLARILEHHRPLAFVLENVRNLERHDTGRTFATIMHVLEHDLGYSVSTRVIDCLSVGAAKARDGFSLWASGRRTAFDFEQLAAIPAGPGPVLGSILETDLDPKYTLFHTPVGELPSGLQGAETGGTGNGFGYSRFRSNDVTRALSARYYKDGSEILVKHEGCRPRRRDSSARMRAPAGLRETGGDEVPGIPVSDIQAYRQFGNAVVVPQSFEPW